MAPSLEAALAHCDQIQAAGLRGDCSVAVLESADALSMERCHALHDALWRDECVFLAAERLWARRSHDEALVTCQQTRFSRPCVWHLLQDEAEAAVAAGESASDAEQRMLPFLQPAARLPDAGMQFWSLWFRLQERADQPVDGGVCGGLSRRPLCVAGLDLYIQQSLSARQRAGRAVCTDPLQAGWVDEPEVRGSVDRWVAHHCAGQ